MFDAFTKVVAQADARGEFLNAGQIDALAAMVAESNKRMDAVNRITSNASKIVTNAARDLRDSALISLDFTRGVLDESHPSFPLPDSRREPELINVRRLHQGCCSG